MNNFDMVIATKKNLMAIEVQKQELMKMHLDALEKVAKEDEPLMSVGALMFRTLYNDQSKSVESMKGTLQNYIKMKEIHEE